MSNFDDVKKFNTEINEYIDKANKETLHDIDLTAEKKSKKDDGDKKEKSA